MLKRPAGNEFPGASDPSIQDNSPASEPVAEAAHGLPEQTAHTDSDEAGGAAELDPGLEDGELDYAWLSESALGEAEADAPAEIEPVSVDASQLFSEDAADEALSEDEQPSEGAPGVLAQLLSGDAQAFMFSLIVHTILILGLALIPVLANRSEPAITLTTLPALDVPEQLEVMEDLAFAEEPTEQLGANSLGETGMALSTAAIVADVPDVEQITPQIPTVTPALDINTRIQQSVGLVRADTAVKGMTGVGTTGTEGAIDQITYELLQSMEERPTLVVWFFDQSGSLQRRREEIRDRFDRVYEELGIIQEARGEDKKDSDEPLLTSILAFGDKVSLRTPKPTADMNEIREAINSIDLDQTGNEKIFSAFYLAVEKYKSYRTSRSGHGPERNVIFIAVTDERGDDPQGLEATIKECRKFAIPVYVIGVPAPFGREFTYVKYVDPDPKFDQSPQWAQVDQGPESLMPERVKLGYRDNFYEEPVMDSGFGPYALSRLAYETGGIYFTVHPNRKFDGRVSRREIEPFASDLEYFFDPEIMSKYRPDYVSKEDYVQKAKESPLRQVLIQAAQMSAVETLQLPRTRFVRRDEATLANELTTAQQQAARLQPQLEGLSQILLQGQQYRDKETSPRWLAGYDLAVGTVLAHKVRAEAYNAMLAKAKRGMAFEKPKDNTWVLKADSEISVGSKLEKEAETARELLKGVVEQHAGTPWAVLAKRELDHPIGWKWVEEFTDLNPPKAKAGANNPPPNVPRPAQDEKARMLAPQAPKRPIPKL